MLEQIAPWITLAIVLVVFAWLLKDNRDLRRDMGEDQSGLRRGLTARLDGLDERIQAAETGLAELRGRPDGMDSQFAFLRDTSPARTSAGAGLRRPVRTSDLLPVPGCPAFLPRPWGRVFA